MTPVAASAPIIDDVARAIADAATDADRIVHRLRALDVRVVTVEEPAYPRRLAAIAMPPHVLYMRGSVAALSRERAVAVVGTRRSTAAGRSTAARIATALVAADAAVVSGLAFGIDGAAHEATLRAGGTTVAVIGGGHAAFGRSGHLRLADAVLGRGGAVVSELAPDVEASKGTFPRRNRIISGLTDATVVVEAPARVRRAHHRLVGAGAGSRLLPRARRDRQSLLGGLPRLPARVPGGDPHRRRACPSSSPTSATPGEPVVGDALAAASAQDLGLTETAVAQGLVDGRATVDELVATTDLPVATVLAALTLLERRGLTSGVHGRYRPAGTLLGEQTSFRTG